MAKVANIFNLDKHYDRSITLILWQVWPPKIVAHCPNDVGRKAVHAESWCHVAVGT